MRTIKNKIWDVDKRLFDEMNGKYNTPEESNFFQTMRYKEECEPALANDLILSENTNPEGLYIVRELYDVYVVGIASLEEEEMHVMNLHEALNIKLSEVGLSNNDLTLWEWLRHRNYQGVTYNHNYDLM